MKQLLPRRMKDQFKNNLDAFGKAIDRAHEKRLEAADTGS
jgi:hypothetical protein